MKAGPRVAFGGLLLLVAGCARNTSQEAPGEMAAAPESFEYIARGNEPFWSVRVTPGEIRFMEPDNLPGVPGAYNPPTRQGGSLLFRSSLRDSAGTAVELTLDERPCTDSMSGQAFPYTATARVGDRVLHGCGERRPLAAAAKLTPGQAVTLRGEIGPGAECPMLLVEPGRSFSLSGDLGRFTLGDRVCVQGTIVEVSFCMAGEATIGVTSIAPADSCP